VSWEAIKGLIDVASFRPNMSSQVICGIGALLCVKRHLWWSGEFVRWAPAASFLITNQFAISVAMDLTPSISTIQEEKPSCGWGCIECTFIEVFK